MQTCKSSIELTDLCMETSRELWNVLFAVQNSSFMVSRSKSLEPEAVWDILKRGAYFRTDYPRTLQTASSLEDLVPAAAEPPSQQPGFKEYLEGSRGGAESSRFLTKFLFLHQWVFHIPDILSYIFLYKSVYNKHSFCTQHLLIYNSSSTNQ